MTPATLRLDQFAVGYPTEPSSAANDSQFSADRLTRDDLPVLPQVYRLVGLDERVLPERDVRFTAVVRISRNVTADFAAS